MVGLIIQLNYLILELPNFQIFEGKIESPFVLKREPKVLFLHILEEKQHTIA